MYPIQTNGKGTPMPVYIHIKRRRLPLSSSECLFWNFLGFERSEENVVHVFLNYDRPSHGFLPSQRLIASHPQQDIGKGNKKNWDLQENRKVSCKSQIKLVIKQHIFKAFSLTGRKGDNAFIPKVLPWARSFLSFSPCLNHMQKFNDLLLNQAFYTHV